VPDPPDAALAEFGASVAVRLQARARRAGARALAVPVPPAPSAPHARALVLASLLTHLGPPNAESFDAESELERTLGWPVERRRMLEFLDPEDLGLLVELSELDLVSCSIGELFEPLVVVTHARWRSRAWQRRALRVLSPAVREAGLRAVLIAAPAPSLWKLERCLPAGCLALLHPIASHNAAGRDAQTVLAARDENAPPGPWYAAAHLHGQPVAWAPATHDALLLPTHPALGLDGMRSRAERTFPDVLAQARPKLRGVHPKDAATVRGWEMAIDAAERLLLTAQLVTSELSEPEQRARDRLAATRARAIASDRATDWTRHATATAQLLALMLERRRLAHQRLTHPARAAATISALPGVARAEANSTDEHDDRSVTIHTHANPDRAIRLPFDPLRSPLLVHPDGTQTTIELDAATIPYLEAIIACPEDAAQILLALMSTPHLAARPTVRARGARDRRAVSRA
jgi:hypothetical protein